MARITTEDLRRYQSVKQNLKAIQIELDSLYYPVSSVPTASDGSGKPSQPSDPTRQAFYRIEDKKAQLEAKQAELVELIERIDCFVTNEVTDHHVAAIMRIHYIVGKSWRETCRLIYGYSDPAICRQAVKRYMEKNNDEG